MNVAHKEWARRLTHLGVTATHAPPSLEMGLGASGVGVILATPSAVRAVLNLPMGHVSDRLGP